MPTISVIVPVYNVEKYLRCCIDSILAQTFTDIEVLLVDDGSTDSSGAICDEYAEKDSRVRVFHKENGGVSSARNLGLDGAIGKWIMFVDSDDMVAPVICELLISNADDGVMPTCALQKFSDEFCNTYVENGVSFTTYDIREFEKISVDGPVAKLYERELIGDNLRFNEEISFAEDALFNCQYYCRVKKFTITNNKLYYYRVLQRSLSHGRYIPYFLETIMALKSARVELGNVLGLTEDEILDDGYYANLLYSLCVIMNNNLHKDAPENWWQGIKQNNIILQSKEFKKAYAQRKKIQTFFTRRYFIILGISYYTGSYFWVYLLGLLGKLKGFILGKR